MIQLINDIIKTLKEQEGFSAILYKDANFVNTIGYGVSETSELTKEQKEILGADSISDVESITEEQADKLLKLEVLEVINYLESLDWIGEIPVKKLPALINLVYNLGLSGFLKFKNTIKALRDGDFIEAMIEIIDSDYFNDVKGRAIQVALDIAGIEITTEQSRKLYKILEKRIK